MPGAGPQAATNTNAAKAVITALRRTFGEVMKGGPFTVRVARMTPVDLKAYMSDLHITLSSPNRIAERGGRSGNMSTTSGE